MKTSESIKNLSQALLKAQMQMGAAKKDSKNPFFKSNYADLPTVMEVVKGPLNEAGIIVLQPASFRDGKNFITTTLIHGDTGEYMESETEVVSAKQNDPQAFGAAQTYARRFGLQAMLFIPAEDDDGNYASGRTVEKAKAVTASPTANTQSSSIPVAASATPPPSVAVSTAKSSFRKTKPVTATATTTSSADEWS